MQERRGGGLNADVTMLMNYRKEQRLYPSSEIPDMLTARARVSLAK